MIFFSQRRCFVDDDCKITGITGDPLFFLFFRAYQKLLFHNPKFLLKTVVFSQFVLCPLLLELRLVRSRPTGLESNKIHTGRSQHRIINTVYIYVLRSDKTRWNKYLLT